MRNADGSTAKVDLMGAAGVIEGLEMLGFDEDKDPDAYWRASDALDKIITWAVKEERERCALIAQAWSTVTEGAHVIAKGIAEDIRART